MVSVNAEEVKVVTEYLTPYQVKNADGSLGGFSTEVVKAIFKQANITPHFVVMPWARAYEVAKSEKNTMIFSIARTEERDELFHWLGGLTKEKLYFWGLKKNFSKAINNISQLKNFHIAASRNSNISQYLLKENFNNIYFITVEEQSMKMFYSNRIDLLIETELNIKYRTEKLGFDFNKMRKLIAIDELNNDLSIAMNLQSDLQLVLQLQQAYSEIKQKGIIKSLKKKWSIPH